MNCSQCGLQKICFPKRLQQTDIIKLEEIVGSKPMLEKGERLFSKGMPFSSFYAVKSGVIKVFSEDNQGQEIVHGFYMPGDVVGAEAINQATYPFNAVAIDTCNVCEIVMNQIEILALRIPSLNNHMIEMMGEEIMQTRFHAELLTKKTAEQRIAHFILSTSNRFKNHGYQYEQFRLPILNKDIANYLNLTPETVSRALTKFANKNILTWKRKEVRIYDFAQLELIV